ncbi:MAG: hypothetical protein DI536_17990 [Archangium gephyra]|uniref:Lipoprotein n=1 Tax=Archangium gephyra TaxID=48 RepID=A0A2W5T7Q4_9BACT|nr:MAG: hypothetical protein DI536_17990 [Archangium gephyra]
MTNVLRAAALLMFVSCAEPASTLCTAKWSGELSGTLDCTDSASDALLGLGASPSSLEWRAAGENQTYQLNFQYQVPNPPQSAYENGDSDDQFCAVRLDVLPVGTRAFNASTRPATSSSQVRGSCSITFTSKTDTSNGATKRYTVHGTAKATLLQTNDDSKSISLDVTF